MSTSKNISIVKRFGIALAMLVIVFQLGGCVDDPERALTMTERKQIDSTLIAHQKVLRVQFDSICTTKQDSMVKFYFDSLLQDEIQSIKRLEQ